MVKFFQLFGIPAIGSVEFITVDLEVEHHFKVLFLGTGDIQTEHDRHKAGNDMLHPSAEHGYQERLFFGKPTFTDKTDFL